MVVAVAVIRELLQQKVQVVPVVGEDKKLDSLPVVNAALIRDAEAAAADAGLPGWLVTRKRKVLLTPVERAKAVAAGEGDPLFQDDPEEKVETVIEQSFDHRGMIDLMAVKRVALWAVSADADPMNAPDFVPKWACRLGVEGLWLEIDQITEWVVGLKR